MGTGRGARAVVAAIPVGERGSVRAVDNSKGMLALAKRKARKLHLNNIRYKLAGLASLQLPEESFDAVISSYGMPDQASDTELALPRLFKAMKHDARLCFCERAGDPEEPDAIIKRLLRKYRVAEADSKVKARRRLEASQRPKGNGTTPCTIQTHQRLGMLLKQPDLRKCEHSEKYSLSGFRTFAPT